MLILEALRENRREKEQNRNKERKQEEEGERGREREDSSVRSLQRNIIKQIIAEGQSFEEKGRKQTKRGWKGG